MKTPLSAAHPYRGCSRRLWPIFAPLFCMRRFWSWTCWENVPAWTAKQGELFLICVNVAEAGDNQFSCSPSKKCKGQVLGGITASLWGRQPAPRRLIRNKPGFLPWASGGRLGLRATLAGGPGCTSRSLSTSGISEMPNFIYWSCNSMLSPTSHGKSNTFLYGLILVILHNIHPEITQARFVFSLSKQTCLFLSHQQRSSPKCPCGIFINQITNLQWTFEALFISPSFSQHQFKCFVGIMIRLMFN